MWNMFNFVETFKTEKETAKQTTRCNKEKNSINLPT